MTRSVSAILTVSQGQHFLVRRIGDGEQLSDDRASWRSDRSVDRQTAWAQQYEITTIAGGVPPLTPAIAVDTNMGEPQGLAADAEGHAYFTSPNLNCVFRLDPDGTLTRVAGTRQSGYSGDGGAATSAQLSFPSGAPSTTQGTSTLPIRTMPEFAKSRRTEPLPRSRAMASQAIQAMAAPRSARN